MPDLLKLSLTLILLQALLLSAFSSGPISKDSDDDDDLEGFQELLAIDEEEEKSNGGAAEAQGKPSEAEVLTKAQRIVLELSNENVKQVIDENEFVLLLGYAPWDPRSAELMPRFAEAATKLRETGSPVLVAKVDAERYTKAASMLGVKGFPTILLFVNGSSQSYSGGFTSEEIVIWARKKSGYPVFRLSSVTTAEEFVKRQQIYVIGLFENYEGPEYKEFVKAATTNNEIQFVEANDTSIAKVLIPEIGDKTNFLSLVKSEPERFEYFEEILEEQKILQFIEYNKFPLVTTLTEVNSARVYSSLIKIQVFIFAEADDFKQHVLPVQDVARKYKTKIMFVYVDSSEDNLAKPFLTLFGIEPEKPIVTAFDNRVGSKYLMESDLTHSNLEEFCLRLLHGTLSPYFKSEPKPNSEGIIEKVVGSTFATCVLDSAENVFLEVYTPWCIDCDTTSKQIEKLAKHFTGQSNIRFARIDASLNEHPKLQIDNYPTLLFYPAGEKSNPIKLSKKSSLKEMAAFIRENMKSVDDRVVSSTNDVKKDEL